MRNEVTNALLEWYDLHARSLPWRGIRDPYATWVSETMLQQTRVETVLRYYPRFMERFPTVQALAEAPIEDVLKQWEGLGYYRRARNLQKGAQQVCELYGGVIPSDPDQLLKLCGVGEYTSGAIAAIAYNRKVPAVDGNVIRVISRLHGIRENAAIPAVHRQIVETAAALLPDDRPGDFDQALMDLGATVCTPGTPDCERCPLQMHCDACEAGDADELPLLPRKTPPRVIGYDVALIQSGDRLLMRQRSERMLEGLWTYPMLEGFGDESNLPDRLQALCGITVHAPHRLGEGRHIFTHQIWMMHIYHVQTDHTVAPDGWRFVSLDEMRQLALPSAMKVPFSLARKVLT